MKIGISHLMKWKRRSVLRQILSLLFRFGFAFVILLAAVLLIDKYKQDKAEEIRDLLNQMSDRSQRLEAESVRLSYELMTDNTFHETGTNNTLEDFEVIKADLDDLLAHEFDLVEIPNQREDIAQKLNEFYNHFLLLTRLIKELGFKDYGLEGSWRTEIHEAEKIIDERLLTKVPNGKDLRLLLLEIRRDEKDYLLRSDESYFFKNLERVKKLDRLALRFKSLPEQLHDSLFRYATSITAYREKRIQLQRVKNEVSGKAVKLRETISDLKNNVIDELEQQEAYFNRTLPIMVILLFVGLSGMFLWQVRKLLLPFKDIIYFARKISTGLFDQTLSLGRNDEFLELEQELNLMASQLGTLEEQSRLATLGKLAGDIAHEIKNPLSVVMARIQMLQKKILKGDFDPEHVNAEFEVIRKYGHRIDKIVSSMKSASRNAENDPLEKVSLANIIEEVTTLSEDKLKNQQITFTVESIPGVQLMAHASKLEQVFINLLNNSIDAIASMNVKNKWIKVSFDSQNDRLKILFTDSGLGIPEKIRNKIMQPYFTTKESGKGTGLGMSISLKIIESYGGKLYYNPDSPNTQFVVELPISEKINKDHAA